MRAEINVRRVGAERLSGKDNSIITVINAMISSDNTPSTAVDAEVDVPNAACFAVIARVGVNDLDGASVPSVEAILVSRSNERLCWVESDDALKSEVQVVRHQTANVSSMKTKNKFADWLKLRQIQNEILRIFFNDFEAKRRLTILRQNFWGNFDDFK